MRELPRIDSVSVRGPATLRVRWRGRRSLDTVDLTGWIATGGEALVALKNEDVFARARIENYGAAVACDDRDLAIDAVHLKALADEQKPFSGDDLKMWQTELRLSNNEAADLLGVALSTWNAYKSSAAVPTSIAMLCRATLRDPILMQ